jgi:hypothetical protein
MKIALAQIQDKYLFDKPLVLDALNYLVKNANLLQELQEDLDQAIRLFNKFINSEKICEYEEVLINSIRTRELIGIKLLPSTDVLLNEINKNGFELEKSFFEVFLKFNFINTMTDINRLARVLPIACYRTYLLVRNPEFKIKDIQIASTLEEMLGVMYLSGTDTTLFQAIKPWILDLDKVDFSEQFVSLINN